MDKLEKMMKENRELFMDQEPQTGHIDRFEKRLAMQSSRKRTLQLTYRISRFAAVGLLMLMSSLWAYNEFIRPEEKMMLGDVNKEYQEVEFFFTSQINTKYEELKDSPLLEDDEYKQSLLEELNQMDSEYNNLQKEMEANPGDERIINAMIQHYQTKLQVITDILNQLKSFQEQNNSQLNNPNQYESVEL
jgi:hypothetical protein